jgi:hypothetical protein
MRPVAGRRASRTRGCARARPSRARADGLWRADPPSPARAPGRARAARAIASGPPRPGPGRPARGGDRRSAHRGRRSRRAGSRGGDHRCALRRVGSPLQDTSGAVRVAVARRGDRPSVDREIKGWVHAESRRERQVRALSSSGAPIRCSRLRSVDRDRRPRAARFGLAAAPSRLTRTQGRPDLCSDDLGSCSREFRISR